MRFLIGLIFLSCMTLLGQEKKPTLMVVPSDLWCFQNDFYTSFDGEKFPDYARAFQESPEVLQVVSQINGMMAERGFPMKNLENVLKTLKSNALEDELKMSKETGSDLRESPMDMLRKSAKADIIVQLTWTVEEQGPKKAINFILQGIDAYTNKQVATATGIGEPSFAASIPVLLSEAVTVHIDDFANSLQAHFDDLYENGREIIIRIQVWDDWDKDLESEIEGREIGFIIEDWLADNTKNGSFNTSDITENMAIFEQVRIPLIAENGRAMDARRYTRQLSKFLSEQPYSIPNKLMMKGLGRATLILGSK
ncbi:hypothetical protein FLP08_13565 [Gramella aestuarii]|uniref:Uncharacterized protein n=2 Tax=Christiangramia aestuarii TaxID=1028746 RepID=A0A7K1LS54_9FLAO|nr:hypothetical protein [Christiangramia aestuarii]